MKTKHTRLIKYIDKVIYLGTAIEKKPTNIEQSEARTAAENRSSEQSCVQNNETLDILKNNLFNGNIRL